MSLQNKTKKASKCKYLNIVKQNYSAVSYFILFIACFELNILFIFFSTKLNFYENFYIKKCSLVTILNLVIFFFFRITSFPKHPDVNQHKSDFTTSLGRSTNRWVSSSRPSAYMTYFLFRKPPAPETPAGVERDSKRILLDLVELTYICVHQRYIVTLNNYKIF